MINLFKNKKNQSNNTIDIQAKCPKCDGKIIDTDNYWVCENYKLNKCTFKIGNIYKNEKISLDKLAALQNCTSYGIIDSILKLKK